jgi:hypothetical protein
MRNLKFFFNVTDCLLMKISDRVFFISDLKPIRELEFEKDWFSLFL